MSTVLAEVGTLTRFGLHTRQAIGSDAPVSIGRELESAQCVNSAGRHKSMQGLDHVRSCHGYGTVHFSKDARITCCFEPALEPHQSAAPVRENGRWPLHLVRGCWFANKQPGVRIPACHCVVAAAGVTTGPLTVERYREAEGHDTTRHDAPLDSAVPPWLRYGGTWLGKHVHSLSNLCRCPQSITTSRVTDVRIRGQLNASCHSTLPALLCVCVWLATMPGGLLAGGRSHRQRAGKVK
jgi:hypothetical protein